MHFKVAILVVMDFFVCLFSILRKKKNYSDREMEKKQISVSLCVLIHSYCVMVETELCSPD